MREYEYEGDLETHLTVNLSDTSRLGELRRWAEIRGIKFLHIVLERGDEPSQPMLTWRGSGVLSEAKAKAEEVARELASAGFLVVRVKIEAAPWNKDVPQNRVQLNGLRSYCHFEHHIKLLLPANADKPALIYAAQRHRAHLSRNAVRHREDGLIERFVTHRVYAKGRDEARAALGALLDDLKPLGYPILDVEEEYVAYDSNLALDSGWLASSRPDAKTLSYWGRLLGRKSPSAPPQERQPGYPNAFLGGPAFSALREAKQFDPAFKHFPNGFRLGEPTFSGESEQRRWLDARLAVTFHLLRLLEDSPWREHLALRGSLLMREWFGDAAREPKDVDWAFRPAAVHLTDPIVNEFFDDLTRRATENPNVGGDITLLTEQIAQDDIWTYERADGRRIVFPWQAPGLPSGIVQMDMVFGETIWTLPAELTLNSPSGAVVRLWAASQEESLAWKLNYLATDDYPQGKDLYDAVLLAEAVPLRRSLLTEVLKSSETRNAPPTSPDWFHQNMYEDSWEEFQSENPWVEGDLKEWQSRLSRALAPTFAEPDGTV